MAQNPIVLPTSGTYSGLQIAQLVNQALATLDSIWSGPTAPTGSQYRTWIDTSTNPKPIKIYDGTQWVTIATLDTTNHIYSLGAAVAASINGQSPGGSWNRIINGGMEVDQMNAGASVTLANNTPAYTLDQWIARYISSSASNISVQQVADAPPGFTNSLKVTVGTGAGSVGSGDTLHVYQPIEGLNVADLAYGGASAQAASIGIWVKSSVAGTYAVMLTNSAKNRTLVVNAVIATPNTWTYVPISNQPGDTGGTWLTDNGVGMYLYVVLASGSSNQTSTLGAWQAGFFTASNTISNTLLTTSGATFQLTGVSLVRGNQAVPFETRKRHERLAACQRYFRQYGANDVIGTGVCQSTTVGRIFVPFFEPMRSTPSIAVSANADITIQEPAGGAACNASPSLVLSTANSLLVDFTTPGTFTTGRGCFAYVNASNKYLRLDARLAG